MSDRLREAARAVLAEYERLSGQANWTGSLRVQQSAPWKCLALPLDELAAALDAADAPTCTQCGCVVETGMIYCRDCDPDSDHEGE
jgi:hypothetical protein